jgi:fructokinase
MRTAAVGEVLWDVYPDSRFAGGAPANTLRHAVRLGHQGILISRVGSDPPGEALLKALSREADTGCVQIDPVRPTGEVSIRLDTNGNPAFTCMENTAFDALEWDPVFEAVASNADCVITGTLSQRTPLSRRTVQTFLAKAKGQILFDVNFREWNDQVEAAVFGTLPLTGILKMNDREMRRLRTILGGPDGTERFLLWLTESYGIGLAAVTYGEKGCMVTDGRGCLKVPGIPVKAVDTTGCGDAFCAGLLHGRLSGWSLAETAGFANVMGAFTAAKPGAVPDYTLKMLEAFREAVHGGLS